MRVIFNILILISFVTRGQVGGENVYSFLNLPTSARQAALGGSTLTLTNEVNQPLWNPATLSAEMDAQIALNYVNFLSDINYFSGSYAYHFNDHFGTMHTGISYMNYGKFIAADEEGVETGTFKAYDMALSVGYSYQVPYSDIHLGINGKIIHSAIETYHSLGAAVDLGVLYQPHNEPYVIGFTIRNAGLQIKSYENTKESLPLLIQFGWSYQLEHVPIRVYTTFDNLQKWKLACSNPSENTEDFVTGETAVKEPSFFNNALRHVVIGAELFPDKGFNLRFGFNYQRAQEMKLQNARTFGGISLGFGLKVNRLNLNYAYNKYHLASNSHNFSLGINLN